MATKLIVFFFFFFFAKYKTYSPILLSNVRLCYGHSIIGR
ncbi:unnamed protein product [Brassica napus]|uniref:(rape) hypothetical protein n=1 Tax=Brassica napus TaxID=3708 RepID=A0A816VYZ4_BRANA|nr:unnamed protein product [Brassica napus]